LLKIDPGVRAIVSSGYTDNSVMAEYKEYGFSGMVAKPYTIEELRKAVQDVIGCCKKRGLCQNGHPVS
jgi:DNA-binding NarL/FixJ family response regulator